MDGTDTVYKVYTEYDDGYVSSKEFSSVTDAKSYFGNVDERDILFSTLTECKDGETVEIARKDGKKRK